jgi:hypothetical protein
MNDDFTTRMSQNDETIDAFALQSMEWKGNTTGLAPQPT